MKEWNATEICGQLRSVVSEYNKELVIHSVFASTINVFGEDLFFSIVTRRNCLYPMSCRIDEMLPLTELGLRSGMCVIVSEDSISIPQADLVIHLLGSNTLDLSIRKLEGLYIPEDLEEKTAVLKELVRAKGCRDDLSTLVTGEFDNPYAQAITKYLPEFGRAVREDNIRAAELAGAFAGGGVGLTPSSDDLILGYMTIYLARSLAVDPSRLEDALRLTKAIGEEAAKHTNLISGTFLKQCGMGLISENMTKLVIALYSDSKKETIRLCGERILEYGSTSGTDILTGMILSMLNFNNA